MNNNINENYAEETMIAIAKTDGKLKAVELRKINGSFEVLSKLFEGAQLS